MREQLEKFRKEQLKDTIKKTKAELELEKALAERGLTPGKPVKKKPLRPKK